MDDEEEFFLERKNRIFSYKTRQNLQNISNEWREESMRANYVYNFTWMGRPIIQNPVDIVAIQEIVMSVKPDLIIETGVARGGSVVYSASLLELLSSMWGIDGRVLGIDIEIKSHNLEALNAHPLNHRIMLLEGSSIDPSTAMRVREIAGGFKNIMVILDSNHTHKHVLRELEIYAPLVAPGSYCIVLDTLVEKLPKGFFSQRPWDKGNNPSTAIEEWLPKNSEFFIDELIDEKLLIGSAPGGYLRRKSRA